MVTMIPLVKHITMVPVIIAKKYRYQLTIYLLRVLNTNLLHIQVEKILVRVRISERIRNSPQWYDPVFGAAVEWNNDYVASILYMIQDGDLNRNVDTDEII